MAVRRTRLEFEDHYTQIPNAWLRDKRLSFRARGLRDYIMSHRPGWMVSERSLANNGPEGRAAIRTALAELEALGYLSREKQSRGGGGKYGSTEYVLRDPWSENRTTESPRSDQPWSGERWSGEPWSDNRTTKKTREKEHYVEEHQGGDAPSPTCGKHPHGTTAKCRACGDARRRWDAARAREAATPKPSTPIPPRSAVGMCEQHPFYPVPCDRCAEEAAA